MPSRINHTYWGNPSDWIYSNNSQQQCKMCKTYYPDIVYAHNELLNEFYDTSVSVWGVPFDCSVGRKTTVSWYADSSKNVIVEYTEPHLRTNVPLTMLTTSGATPNGNRYNRDPYVYAYYNCRIKDDVSIANRSYSETYPSGTRTASHQFSTTGGGTSPQYNLLSLQTTYYDYRRNIHSINATLCPKTNFGRGSAFLVGNDLDTLISTTWDNLKTTYSYENDEDIVITGASYIVYSGLRLSSSASVRADIQGSAFLYPQVSVVPSTRTKAIYYTAGNDKIGDGIYQNVNHIGLGYISSGTLKYPNLSTLPTATTYFNNKTTAYSSTNDVMSQCDNIFAISRKKQKFSDVEYHWGVGLVYGGESLVGSFNLVDIDNLNLTGITSNQEKFISMVPYLVIDDDKGNGYKMACKYALMHEYAFYGMPFTTSNSDAINSVWDSSCEDIYIPLFDENMMTTGDYVTLKKAYEQYLPQTVWTDLFNEQSIYNYDPDYQPEPEPDPDQDSGDRDNSAYRGIYATGSNRFFALNQSELVSFINFVNNMYVSDPDPDAAETQLKIDYKGSNPNDYIVGIYAVPKALNYLASPENIYLGPVETNVAANKIEVQSEGAFSFGYYDIPAYYGDFRDYEPYTQIELYIPLCGSVKLDASEYIGHRVVVDAIWDIQTGELTARVLRDGITITHTVQGSIAVQMPICSRDMGAYQNNQHQLRMSLISAGLSSLGVTKQQAFSDINSVAQIASTKAGKTPHVGNITSGLNPLNLAENAANTALETYDSMYKLGHMQPQLYITGAASSANAINMERKAYIFIKRCIMLSNYNQLVYAHTIGHACCISGSLSSFSGYTIISAANLDNIQTKSLTPLQATAEEKQILRKALQAGIYI